MVVWVWVMAKLSMTWWREAPLAGQRGFHPTVSCSGLGPPGKLQAVPTGAGSLMSHGWCLGGFPPGETVNAWG